MFHHELKGQLAAGTPINQFNILPPWQDGPGLKRELRDDYKEKVVSTPVRTYHLGGVHSNSGTSREIVKFFCKL